MSDKSPIPGAKVGMAVTTRALLARKLVQKSHLTDSVSRWIITEISKRTIDKHKLIKSAKKPRLQKTGTRDIVVIVLKSSEPEGYTTRLWWSE